MENELSIVFSSATFIIAFFALFLSILFMKNLRSKGLSAFNCLQFDAHEKYGCDFSLYSDKKFVRTTCILCIVYSIVLMAFAIISMIASENVMGYLRLIVILFTLYFVFLFVFFGYDRKSYMKLISQCVDLTTAKAYSLAQRYVPYNFIIYRPEDFDIDELKELSAIALQYADDCREYATMPKILIFNSILMLLAISA